MPFNSLRVIISLALMFVSSISNATLITADFFKSDTNTLRHTGTAIDSSTGKYYQRDSYYNGRIFVYASKSDFENNIIESTLSVNTRGTYFEVINGKIYARVDSTTNFVAVYDANTGTLLQSKAMTDFNGTNGSLGGFEWGGYSSMNFMEDNGLLYIFGGSSTTNTYTLQEVDLDLNILNTYDSGFLKSAGAGFASVIDGTLFVGSSFTYGAFDYKLDLDTLISYSIDFDFSSFFPTTNFSYITNTNYDSKNNTLYISDWGSDSTYAISNVRTQFQITEIPEPSSLIFFGIGILSIRALLSRRLTTNT